MKYSYIIVDFLGKKQVDPITARPVEDDSGGGLALKKGQPASLPADPMGRKSE
ncbi:hypothetical protein [Cohnella cellulosilytica]|uniref:Uncharacterized protein n=1 Tax=Cohnella cellulosilytica TaxID=986710 RepID=A0ABW2FEK3_9BACL